MADAKRQIIGRRSNASGNLFEGKLNASCNYYRDKGIAIIEKTPEPMRIIKPFGDRRQGLYVACFEKQAQPDYKGVLCDGGAVIFEAKHTDKDRILESVVTETQRKNLDDFMTMGARCFVIVSMGFQDYYRVPWDVFGNMKSHFGRKYMTMEDLKPYELKQYRGTVLILEGVALNENFAGEVCNE